MHWFETMHKNPLYVKQLQVFVIVISEMNCESQPAIDLQLNNGTGSSFEMLFIQKQVNGGTLSPSAFCNVLRYFAENVQLQNIVRD